MIQISKLKLVLKDSSVICTRFYAYNLLRYQVSINRTIGPMVTINFFAYVVLYLKMSRFSDELGHTVLLSSLYTTYFYFFYLIRAPGYKQNEISDMGRHSNTCYQRNPLGHSVLPCREISEKGTCN